MFHESGETWTASGPPSPPVRSGRPLRDIEVTLQHARLIAKHKPLVDSFVARILDAPVASAANRFEAAYSASYHDALDAAANRQRAFFALAFVIVWALVAWCGYQAHAMQIVNLATAVIAARIFVAYIEVFGSLLATGAGLIVSGVLLLALAWVWVRKIRLQPGGAA